MLLLTILLACAPDPPTLDDSGEQAPCEGVDPAVTDLTPDGLSAMLDDVALINVHVPYAGEIDGTEAHLAYTDVDAIEAWLDHDVAAPVALYCLTGPMSETAAQQLAERGYCNVYDLPGGMVAWEQAGYLLSE